MSETDDHSGNPRDEDELIAAEYALGVLSGTERSGAEHRLAGEPAFARLVGAWQERLAPMVTEIDEVSPPPHVWDRVAAALPAPPAPRSGLWSSLAFWRGFGLVSALAAACLALFIYFGAINPGGPLVAAIDGGGQHHFVATIDAKRSTIAVLPAAFNDVTGRVAELWLIPADGKPRALGLLQADHAVTLAVPDTLAPLATRNAVLAVSLEPPGGSSTGQPTGPVIGSGKLENL
jgi:anti-sigma-K factor RskA